MEVLRPVHKVKEVRRQARTSGRTVGFVPTMGALHAGHVSLIRRARRLADLVVVSIFVNPAQFGPHEDLAAYPRELERDTDVCLAEDVDYVFAPEAGEIYPPDCRTFVEVAGLSDVLEGASRPGHFRGVTTVVSKLFQIVQPTLAVFGQKDAQQSVVIKRMVRDLMMDVEIVIMPTLRDEDGLALSSRNRHLAAEGRRAALAIPRSLDQARQAVEGGQRQADKIVRGVVEALESERLRVDYVALVEPESFAPVKQVTGETLLLVAARAGDVRLIDNAILG